jgi:hypothetical protein
VLSAELERRGAQVFRRGSHGNGDDHVAD